MKFCLIVISFLVTGWVFPAWGKESAKQEPKHQTKISYSWGKGLSLESNKKDFKFVVSGLVQSRLKFHILDQAADKKRAEIQRAKIIADLYTPNPNWHFNFAVLLSTKRTPSQLTGTIPEDYFVEWTPSDHVGVKAGQYKVPFLRQEVLSDTKLQFVDRSSANGNFSLKRDFGLTIQGSGWNKKIRYAVYGMNGDGANTFNKKRGFILGTRLEYDMVGHYDNEEPDLEYSKKPSLGVGFAYLYHDNANSQGSRSQSGTLLRLTNVSYLTVDSGIKYKGFSALGAFILTRAHENGNSTNGGYNFQAGYFVVPKRLEIVAKTGGIIFDRQTRNRYEYGVALNGYIKGHALKLQTDYAYLVNDRGWQLNDHRIRVQAQVLF